VISLIGYRGSGKSSVAPRLARKLGWEWVDSDDVVEQTTGSSIRELFADCGEAKFREIERDVLRELCGRTGLVIATGGGAILLEENRQRLRAAGPVVWLHVSAKALIDRLSRPQAAERRPSLTGRPIAEEVQEVLNAREPLYRDCATIIVDAESSRPENTARFVLRQVAGLVIPSTPSAREPD
jgi:shikimate kinase